MYNIQIIYWHLGKANRQVKLIWTVSLTSPSMSLNNPSSGWSTVKYEWGISHFAPPPSLSHGAFSSCLWTGQMCVAADLRQMGVIWLGAEPQVLVLCGISSAR